MRKLAFLSLFWLACATESDPAALTLSLDAGAGNSAPVRGPSSIDGGVDLRAPDPEAGSDARTVGNFDIGHDLRPVIDTGGLSCLLQLQANDYASATASCATCTDSTFERDFGWTDCSSACRGLIDCYIVRGCKSWRDGGFDSAPCAVCITSTFRDSTMTPAGSWLTAIIEPYCPTFFSATATK